MSILHKNKEYFANASLTVDEVKDEINNGLALLNKIEKPIVTFFGSHKISPESEYYEDAKKAANILGKAGYAVLTGGGPGVMQAANCGASDAKAPSIGLEAKLSNGENVPCEIFTARLPFRFIFARRFIMSIKSEALIFYPGGYGTLNELFEYAMLMQTGVVDTVPIICVDKKYWQGLFDWLNKNPLKDDFFTNGIQDLKLLHFVENSDEIIKIIKK